MTGLSMATLAIVRRMLGTRRVIRGLGAKMVSDHGEKVSERRKKVCEGGAEDEREKGEVGEDC